MFYNWRMKSSKSSLQNCVVPARAIFLKLPWGRGCINVCQGPKYASDKHKISQYSCVLWYIIIYIWIWVTGQISKMIMSSIRKTLRQNLLKYSLLPWQKHLQKIFNHTIFVFFGPCSCKKEFPLFMLVLYLLQLHMRHLTRRHEIKKHYVWFLTSSWRVHQAVHPTFGKDPPN